MYDDTTQQDPRVRAQAEQKACEQKRAYQEAERLTPQGGIPMGYAVAGQQEPLLARLQRRCSDNANETTRYHRAVQILQRHPEFEELIELLQSGLV